MKWVGQVYWYQRDLTKALKNFELAGALLQEAHAAEPNDDDLTFKLATARNDAGHVREARGDLVAAQREYTAYLQIFQALHQREPTDSKWQTYLGYAWDDLGKIALERGHLDRAIANYRADQQIKAVIAGHDPANRAAQVRLLVSDAILGRTLALCGYLNAALHYTGEAVSSAAAVAAFDPANATKQEYVALYRQQLGGLLRQARRPDTAAIENSKAINIFAKLVAKDPTNDDWQQEYVQARIEAARLKLQQGDAAGAQALADTALQTLQALRKKNGADRSLSLLAAQASVVLGKIAATHGDATTARIAWTKARVDVAPLLIASNDPNALATAASASLLLDETDMARPLLAKLAAMGYRTPDFEALVATKHFAYAVDAVATRRITAAMKAAPKMNP